MLRVTIKHQSPHEQLDLFLRPPNRPAWEQLSTAQRDEVRRLLVQILITLVSEPMDILDKEADHE